jgi:hypothetical protein
MLKSEEDRCTRAFNRGRSLFFIGAGLLVAVMVVNAAASVVISDYANPTRLNPIMGTAISLGLLVGLYFGHFTAKVLIGVQVAFGLLANATVLYRVLFQNWTGPTTLLCCTIGMLAVAFVLLCFSPSVSAYVERNQHHRQTE